MKPPISINTRKGIRDTGMSNSPTNIRHMAASDIYTYSCRIRGLSKSKHKKLVSLFTHLGWLRNQTIDHCKTKYENKEKHPSKFDLFKWLTDKRVDERTGYWNVTIQRSTLNSVDKAYQSFFRKIKLGEKTSLPRFKPISDSVKSFETSGSNVRKKNKRHYIQIKNVGKLYFKDTRNVLETGKCKLARIVKHPLGSGYDIQLVVEIPKEEKEQDQRDVIGIDMGVRNPMVLSNGQEYPKFGVDKTKEKRLQRKLAKAKRGSNNRNKKKLSVARESRRNQIKASNIRHRATTDIIKNHSSNLVVEKLQTKNLTKHGGNRKRNLNRGMLETSPNQLKQMLSYKAQRGVGKTRGKLVEINAAYTSQDCSDCGHRKELSLRDRIYDCENCSLILDRDLNAAKNIRLKGLKSFDLGGAFPGMLDVENIAEMVSVTT